MKTGKTTTRYGDHGTLIKRLAVRHPLGQWVFIPNLRVGTGFSGFGGSNPNAEQVIDAWAMSCWESQNFRTFAYEVKVSRMDFFRELAHPDKRQAALKLSNYFYFVVPSPPHRQKGYRRFEYGA